MTRSQTSVRAVIVDHRPSTRQVLRQLFEEAWGWAVVGEAADSAEAVTVVRASYPDVIVVDSNPADPALGDLATMVAPLGSPVVVGLLDFPHEHASAKGPAVLKGVPTDHIRQVILKALVEAHPEDERWSTPEAYERLATSRPDPSSPFLAPAPQPALEATPAPVAPADPADQVVWSDDEVLNWAQSDASPAPAAPAPAPVAPDEAIPSAPAASAESAEPWPTTPVASGWLAEDTLAAFTSSLPSSPVVPVESVVAEHTILRPEPPVPPVAEPVAAQPSAPQPSVQPEPSVAEPVAESPPDHHVGMLSSLLGADDDDDDVPPLRRPRRRSGASREEAATPAPTAEPEQVWTPDDTRPAPAGLAQASAWSAGLISESADVRRTTLLELLQVVPSAQSAELAARAVGDPDVEIRHLALQVLERSPQLAPTEGLRQACVDPDMSIRARALALLGQAGRLDHLEILAGRAVVEQDPPVRGAALTGLAHLLGQSDPSQLDASTISKVVAAFSDLDQDMVGRFAREMGQVAQLVGPTNLVTRITDADPRVSSGATTLYNVSSERLAAAAPGPAEPIVAPGPVATSALAPAPAAAPSETVDLAAHDTVLAPPAPEGTGADGPQSGGPGAGEPPAWTPPAAPATPRPADFGPSNYEGFGMADQVNDLALAALTDALSDPDPTVRQGALNAVIALPGEQVAAWLVSRVRAGDPRMVEYIERVSGRVDFESSARALAESLLDLPEGEARDRLGRIVGSLRSIPSVIGEGLDQPEVKARQRAMRLAGLAGGLTPSLLTRALADASVEVRLAAVSAATAPLGEEMAETLITSVRSDTSAVVAAAAGRALAGAPEDMRLVAADACLRHRDSTVRQEGVRLVPVNEDGSSVLVKLVGDNDERVAGLAAEALAAFPATEVVMTVWPRLRTAQPAAVVLMIDLLARTDRHMTERLARNAADSVDAIERMIGLQVVVRVEGEGMAERINKGLSDPAREVRLLAARSLLEHPEVVSIADIGGRTRDPDPEIRRTAVEVLVAADDDRVVPYMLDAARDPVLEVRSPARAFLQTRTTGSSAENLVAALADPARRAVAAELLEASPQVAVEMIIRDLPNADPDTRAAMAKVLAAPASTDILVAGLAHPEPSRRLVALRGLGLVAGPDSVAQLTVCLDDPEPEIRREACHVLSAVPDPAAAAALRRVLVSDPDMDVVGDAEEALRRMGQIQSEPNRRDNDSRGQL